MGRRNDFSRGEPPTLGDALGGPFGLLESSLPGIAYVVSYVATGSDTTLSAAISVVFAFGLAVARIIRRESPQHALRGLFGVAIAAFVAAKSGRAEDFYLPGLLLNTAYASAFLLSLLVRRPLVGVVVAQLDGEAGRWRSDPKRVRAFTRATWLWAGLFLLRLLVQLPLYLSHAVVELGIARTAMGVPLFALGVWLTWRLVRRTASPPEPAAAAD